MSAFELSVRAPETLALNGDLSFATAADALPAIRARLAGSAVSQLDLAGLRHSDSAGLACLLAVLAEGRQTGRKLSVIGMPEGMLALAQVCEVDQLMH